MDNTADTNRRRRLLAIRELDQLLDRLADPDFAGSAVVEIHAKGGRLGRPKASLTWTVGGDTQDQ